MLPLSPKKLTLHEDDPASVVSYDVQVRDHATDAVIAEKNVLPATTGDTVVGLGDPEGMIYTEEQRRAAATPPEASLVGASITIFVRQTGPSGEVSPFVQAANPDGTNYFTVRQRPNGPEGATVEI